MVESVFNRWCVVRIYFLAFFVVLDFQVELGWVYFKCTVPWIQSFTHVPLLCSHWYPTPPSPASAFEVVQGLIWVGSIGFFATYFFIRKISGSIKID